MQFYSTVHYRNDAVTDFEVVASHHQEDLVDVSSHPEGNNQRLLHAPLDVIVHGGINWLNHLGTKQNRP